ncbi:MAG: hypothetical protein JW751_15060 [Polyangiaceae bacterium]|nr:hypothetical protein [Polyangiaceae bacterium]
MRHGFLLGVVLLFAGCSDDELGDAQLSIYLDSEDNWGAPPAIETVEVFREDTEGNREDYGTFEVTEDATYLTFPITGPTASFDAVGYDVGGEAVANGRSFLLYPDGLRGTNLPLFMGRKQRFASPGSLVAPAGEDPCLTTLGGRFLLSSGLALGSTVNVYGFDFGLWQYSGDQGYDEFACPIVGSCNVRSMAVVDDGYGTLIADDWALWIDFVYGYSAEYQVPSRLDSFADVAGGATVNTNQGTAYIVGPTRAEATDAILRISEDGELAAVAATTPRAAAATTWIPERGLILVGGSEAAPGIEILADTSRDPALLSFPPDETAGAALVPFDDSLVLRIGGIDADGEYAQTVVLDLGCTEDCVPIPHSPPVELTEVQAFRLGEQILVFGTDAEGENAARLLDESGLGDPIPLRDPRSRARAIQTYLGYVAVVGGTLASGADAKTIELYIP